jgi:uncharacterized DUF497 family protein
MNWIEFDWDRNKAVLNKKKHGISFDEAVTVFYDDNALEFFDPDHSEVEDRFIMLGMSFKARVLVVCHCVREKGCIIRIISARKSTKKEARKYWKEKP